MKIEQLTGFGKGTIYFRDATSDSIILHANLMAQKREYVFPLGITPRTVLDIGANIGIVAVLMANLYPKAVIHAFEPQADNFSLLEMNTKPYDNIKRHRYGLGKRTGKCRLFPSNDATNFGGYSLFESGSDASRQELVEIMDVNEAMRWLGVTTPDLIKIDCEGAEYDILMSMEALANTKWILGELHGQHDYELLAFLSHGFDLGLEKELDSHCSHFTARRKA